jgi:hypothetical protein
MENAALAILQAGSLLPADAMLFIASAWVDLAISDDFDRYLDEDPGLVEILESMSMICEAHGVEGWPPGKGPQEFETLRAEWAHEWRKTRASYYRQQEQPVLAWLIQNDFAQFTRRFHNGAQFFKRG